MTNYYSYVDHEFYTNHLYHFPFITASFHIYILFIFRVRINKGMNREKERDTEYMPTPVSKPKWLYQWYITKCTTVKSMHSDS